MSKKPIKIFGMALSDFDVVGHYARTDIFRLSVNSEPLPPCDQ
jgi:hypothetical protein